MKTIVTTSKDIISEINRILHTEYTDDYFIPLATINMLIEIRIKLENNSLLSDSDFETLRKNRISV